MDFNDTIALEHVSDFQKSAIHLEDALAISLDSHEIINEHNPFDENFPITCFDGIRGQGIDNKVITPSGKKIALECKNLYGKHKLTKEWFIEEFFNRDKGIQYLFRILVISILNCSEEVRRWLIEDMKIKIWELGFKITTSEQKQKAIEFLKKKTYWLKMKFFYHKVKTKIFPIFHTRQEPLPEHHECFCDCEHCPYYEDCLNRGIESSNTTLYSSYSYLDKYRDVVSNR